MTSEEYQKLKTESDQFIEQYGLQNLKWATSPPITFLVLHNIDIVKAYEQGLRDGKEPAK